MKTIITIILLAPFILFSQEEGLVHWLSDTTHTRGHWQGGVESAYEENSTMKIVLGKKKLNKILSIDPITGASSESIYDLSYPTKKTWFSEILEFDQKRYAIFNDIDKSEDKFKVYSLLLENECCDEFNLIYEHEFYKNGTKNPISLTKKSNTVQKLDAEAKFRLSEDSSKLVFINQRFLNPKGKVDEIQLAVFNSNFTLMWEKALNLPYRDVNLIIEEVAISNDGQHVFLLAGIPDNWRYSYVLYHITTNDISEIKLNLKEDCYPVAIFPMIDNEENSLIIRGLFVNKNDRRAYVSGVFWGQKNMFDKKRPRFHYSRFTEDEQKEIDGETFHVSDIQFFDNGNVHLLFDSKYSLPLAYIKYPTMARTGNVNSLSPSNYNELISCTFSSTGALINTNIIDRRHSREFDGVGYSLVYWDNAIFLFFDTRINKEQGDKFNLNVSRINMHIITELIRIDSRGAIIGENLLWSTMDSSFSFEDVVAQKVGDRIFLGGKIQKNVQGPGSIYGDRNFHFGYIELKDLTD